MPYEQLAKLPRTREALLNEYPTLCGPGAGQHRLLDECLEMLGVFDLFARETLRHAELLDVADPDHIREPLNAILDVACRYRIFSLAIPRSLGGSGCSMLALSVGLERLAQYCVGVANLVAAHGLALAVIGASGSLRQMRVLADKIVCGERTREAFLLATAATEPSAGSDLEDFEALGRANIESHADPTADGYALFGRKIYVSNGSIASAYVVVMPTDRQRPRETLSAFLVWAKTPGFSVVRTEDKLGQRACPAAELYFDGCLVPREQRLNDTSIAGRTLDMVLGSSRATVGAFGAGIAWGVLNASCRCAAALRCRDGQALLEHPRAQAIVARMWLNAQSARSAYLGAANIQRRIGLVSLMEAEPLRALDRYVPSRLVHGAWADRVLGWEGIDREVRRILAHLPAESVAKTAAFGDAAKILGSEYALESCALSQELLGEEATREDSGIPKFWRDARLLSIYEGTNEVCMLDIAQKTTQSAPTRQT